MRIAAIKLGMNVLGYDPEITVEAAWSLPSQVKKANSIEEVMRSCEFVTLEGHRSVGGMRASLYNAMPMEGVEALVSFMSDFERKHA